MRSNDDQLNQLVTTILSSPKNRFVSPDIIRRIGSQELAHRRTMKEAVKATKSKLHQVAGAYLDANMRYDVWLSELRRTHESGRRDAFLNTCTSVMAYHASTRERLAVLNQFYATILRGIGPIHSVIDVACGFNPLAIPWMDLPQHTNYFAYDIYFDMIEFLNSVMDMIGIHGRAEVCDVLQCPPTQKADVAFILKSLPCLEQVDKTATGRLLEAISADHLLISFSIHSLSGRNKGMEANYETRFHNLMAHYQWSIQKFVLDTELVFLVSK